MSSESQARGKTVFLTGVTGFLGKVVLEELIRRRHELGLQKVAVLIRSTKPSNQTSGIATKEPHLSSRFHDEVASSQCFAQLPSGWTQYVQPFYGDLEKPCCGLDALAYERICQETTHIIHCAACVQFDLALADAIRINVQGTLNILQLARTCSQFQHLAYTSTAYVTPHRGQDRMYEELAPLGPWSSAQELLDGFSSGAIGEGEILRQTGHPNTYSLTKCIAEHLVMKTRGTTPVTIVRPSVISAGLERPYPGWTDSLTAIAGVVSAIQEGGVYALEGHPEADVDLVPVDFVAEFLINETFAPRSSASSLPILYCVSGWKGVKTKALSSAAASYFQHSEIRWLDYQGSRMARLYRLLWQKLPVNLLKALCWISRDNKGVMQLTRASQIIDKLDKNFGYFQLKSFEFLTSRPTLLQKAPCPNPTAYLQMVFRGTQQYMMRCARQRNLVSTERLIAGKEFRSGSKNAMKLLATSRANRVFRLAAVIVEMALSRMFQKVTFDQQSFHDALENYHPGLSDQKLLILPSHRSYVDFVICPYLFYHFPGLGIKIPRIAAQDEFSRLPILGTLLRWLGAFYVQRGIGRPDPQLDEQVRRLVEQDEHILFFPEGQRSRSRQFLAPHRGLLRSLQGTGKSFKVLPISISYERVPEEESFMKEAQEQERSRMNIFGLLRWTYKMIVGRVKLGRMHIKCGKMLDLDSDTDVRSLSHDVLDELQTNTVVTTYHLESFVHHHRHLGHYSHPCHLAELGGQPGGVKWLRKQLEERGATVLDGCLSVDDHHPVSPMLESSLRNQWIHFFYRGALNQCPNDFFLVPNNDILHSPHGRLCLCG
jgi:alcohol-forming fatty acyl-CoA reductase